MNYLAHIFLSGDDDDLKIGNFIADFIYGNTYKDYPANIQKGVLLHRYIDTYTDNHPIFKQSKKRLFEEFRHYSAVIVDMFYDHFLAKNFHLFSNIPLLDFSQKFYKVLDENIEVLPLPVKKILPTIKAHNWLYSYRNLDELANILSQMNHRAAYTSKLHHSVIALKNDYALYEEEFFDFFQDIILVVKAEKMKL